MTVVVDTGPLVAFLNRDDALHERAQALLDPVWRGDYGPPIGTDVVLDEGLTFLRRRPGRLELSRRFAALFVGDAKMRAPLQLRTTTLDLVETALEVHFRHYERGLSFTDAALLAHVEALGATLATFDKALGGLAPGVGPA